MQAVILSPSGRIAQTRPGGLHPAETLGCSADVRVAGAERSPIRLLQLGGARGVRGAENVVIGLATHPIPSFGGDIPIYGEGPGTREAPVWVRCTDRRGFLSDSLSPTVHRSGVRWRFANLVDGMAAAGRLGYA